MDPVISEAKDKMQKALEVLISDLSTIRTGRAAPSLVESIVINSYGGTQRLRVIELATVSVSDPHTLLVSPFDVSIIEEIRKGIADSATGFNPSTDGQVIRISIPPLSEERRQELIHLMKQKLENGKIMIRQVRHEAMNDVKKGELAEDETSRLEKLIQNATDEVITEIDSMGKKKEEELLQI